MKGRILTMLQREETFGDGLVMEVPATTHGGLHAAPLSSQACLLASLSNSSEYRFSFVINTYRFSV
jgi:hypothetical protein